MATSYHIRKSALIEDADSLRAWLARHRVEGLDAGRKDGMRVIKAMPLEGGPRTSVRAAADVLLLLRDELVWQHHPDGDRLPPGTLFALRQQLTA